MGHISKIRRVQTSVRQPAIKVNDLALVLEIDLCLNRRNDFHCRLQRALDDAARQGTKRR